MMESNETGYPAVMFGGNGNFMDEPTEYIFDRSDVRAVFLVLYTIVFCSCFFGKYTKVKALVFSFYSSLQPSDFQKA